VVMKRYIHFAFILKPFPFSFFLTVAANAAGMQSSDPCQISDADAIRYP